MEPTKEQLDAVKLFQTGENLKISAFAGAGKTSTLKMISRSREQSGLYLAFNKKIADEAKAGFPGHVECRTTHSVAFRAVKERFSSITKLTHSIYPRQLSALRQYKKQLFSPSFALDETQLAYIVLKTVAAFCQGDSGELGRQHVPRYGALIGQKASTLEAVKSWTLSEATKLWNEMKDSRSDMPLGHDGYLKLWALDRPKIGFGYILLDEAQDTSPVILDVLQHQDSQIVYVGDRHQQIYEWRGAVNAMANIATAHDAYLTQSFRFGPEIARAASAVLAALGESRQIRGNEGVASSIVCAGKPTAILARTNATVIFEVVDSLGQGKKPFIVGGTEELKRLINDVFELKKRQPAKSPEFFGFTTWPDVVEFAGSEEGRSLKSFVQLVEAKGEVHLWNAISAVADQERDANVVISTAHKAKGCEWDIVKLAGDFLNYRADCELDLDDSEIRLFYVAMTRAKQTLIVAPEILQLFTSGLGAKR